MSRFPIILGGLLMYFAMASAMAASMIILESNTERFVVGDVLDSETAIRLDDGDELLLATESGAFRVVGPIPSDGEGEDAPIEPIGAYVGAGDSDASAGDVLTALVAAGEEDDATVGAVRGGGGASGLGCPRSPPSAWSLRVMRGEQCIADESAVSLWREDATQDTAVQIQRVTTEEEATVTWPSDDNDVEWPDSVPIADGEIYSLRFADDASGQTLIIRKMPAGLKSDMQAIAWLSTHGCRCQALALYNNLQD